MNNTDIIYFAKVKPDAKIPSKREEDSAFDLYACFDEDYMTIKAGTSVLVPTGLISAFDKKYGLVFRERGSTGVKNIKINAGVIDSGYRGEIFVCLYNANCNDIVIAKKNKIPDSPYLQHMNDNGRLYPYEKAIAQALLILIPNVTVYEITQEEIMNITSDRGIGCLGSSLK